MHRKESTKSINILMIVLFAACLGLMIASYFSPSLFILLFIPLSLSIGYLSEHGASKPYKSLIRPQSLLPLVGIIVFFLIADALQGVPVLAMLSQLVFWIFWSSMIVSWLIGSMLFRYLRMPLQKRESDTPNI
jgi:hypothetical protein